eukprot:g5672.t1
MAFEKEDPVQRFAKQQRQLDSMEETMLSIANHLGLGIKANEGWGDNATHAFHGRTFGYALGLDQNHIATVHKAFEAFDKDGNHSLDMEEVSDMMTHLGMDLSQTELKGLFAGYDTDGDASITFDELILFVRLNSICLFLRTPVWPFCF